MAKFVSETFELVRIGYGPNNVAALFLGLKDQMIQLAEGRELWAVSIGGETQTLGVYAFPN